MALDQFKLLSKVRLAAGIDATTTTIALASGQGAKLPSAGPFNLVIWDATVADDPADDPNAESIRVPASYAGGDTLSAVTRGQEGTTAKAHNTSGHSLKAILHLGTKFIADLILKHDTGRFAINLASGSPLAMLHVVGETGSNLAALIDSTADSMGISPQLVLRDSDATAGNKNRFLQSFGGDLIIGTLDDAFQSPSDKVRITSGGHVLIGTSFGEGGFQMLKVASAAAGSTVQSRFENSDNTNAASHSVVYVRSGGASGGDPYALFEVAGGAAVSIGIDNSVTNDPFKVSRSTALGTSDQLVLDSTGRLGIGGNPNTALHLSRNSGELRFLMDQVAVAACVLQLGATVSGGDQYVQFTRAVQQDWVVGMDISDSNAFVISESDVPGSTNKIKIESVDGRVIVSKLAVDVIATASLPAAATAQNGRIIIEDAGAGDRNLILYAAGQRFRIDGGASF